MGRFGQYLLSIVAAALLVSISNVLIEKKGAISTVLKLITGIVLALLIVSPWTDLSFDDFWNSQISHIEVDASSIVERGTQYAEGEVASYIKSEIESYILDKAFALGLDVSVDVTLTEDAPPSVATVSIYGSAAPYVKKQMIFQICEDLGVTEECLTWSQSNG